MAGLAFIGGPLLPWCRRAGGFTFLRLVRRVWDAGGFAVVSLALVRWDVSAKLSRLVAGSSASTGLHRDFCARTRRSFVSFRCKVPLSRMKIRSSRLKEGSTPTENYVYDLSYAV